MQWFLHVLLLLHYIQYWSCCLHTVDNHQFSTMPPQGHSNNSTSSFGSLGVPVTVPAVSREEYKRKVSKNKQILQDQVRQKALVLPLCLCFFDLQHNITTRLLHYSTILMNIACILPHVTLLIIICYFTLHTVHSFNMLITCSFVFWIKFLHV